ncbi:hypothetical protein SAMN05444405_101346 [Bacteroides luti]|uniref:Uncharacterized protein n=1 Tax=Bacteroides luti TaxID=1297750 RepID=A0A1M4TE50_9BACE|nr:hypothetical protein SAMN05444405_101346 [Bacteroides luti]
MQFYVWLCGNVALCILVSDFMDNISTLLGVNKVGVK